MIDSQPYTIKFLQKKELAKETFVFYFSRPEGFKFTTGQYNRWTLPITATDGRGSSRFFTISSSPLDSNYLSLTTKIIQSDFKRALLELKENDEIKIFGPMGNFIFDETNTKPQIFIAGGIGITPFHSILQYVAAKNFIMPLTLFVSFSTPEEIVYFDELKQIEKQHNTIKIIYTVTKPENSQILWNGETGRISQELIQKYVPNFINCDFLIVGPPQMEEATKKLLIAMNIAEGNIMTEQFTGY